MELTFDIAGAQIDGGRDYQEDAFLITHLGDKNGGGSLVVVADGMGGHAAGNVASNLAVQAFNRHVSARYPGEPLPGVLREAVLKANAAIAETVRETPALKGMGCTLVCAVVAGRHLHWVSVGDSILYLLRDKHLKKKNADHSYGGFLDRMAAEGKAVDPEPGFSRNMLMSALTGDEIADIDCPDTPLELQPGDRVIIASDGLDTLSEAQVVYVADAASDARELVDKLLECVEAENLPRQDNTTVVVVDAHESAAAGVPADEPIEEITLESDQDADELVSAPPRPATATVTPAGAAPRRSGIAMVLIGVAVLALGGGAYWYLLEREGPPPAVIDFEPEAPAGEPAPQPGDRPAPDAADEPAAAAIDSGEEPAAGTGDAGVAPAPPTVRPAPGRTFRDRLASGGQGPEMVWIPAGTFTMGGPRMSDERDEKPTREVRVGRFAIGVYEVTLAEYTRFARATGRRVPDNLYLDQATHPAFFVSWDDALYYARWLSQQTGHSYRLPSEAEWEYAARGATTGPYWWGTQPGRGNAHCFGCESRFDPRKPAPIGSFEPNPFGLYDTAGNVGEWVHDCYHPSYAGAPATAEVWEGGDCSVRVVRGGSFANVPKSIRSPARDKARSNVGLDSIGFRVVREP